MINNVRYADDTTLLCGGKEDMMELFGRVQRLSEEERATPERKEDKDHGAG